jgi:adenosylcobinamide kinase / adenosylcobinamide-phosphate guanylyltransferase
VAPSLFIVGGARSGKSRFAIERFSPDARIVFVATAEARDEDMIKRIARHRADRPSRWSTIEEPFELVTRLRRLDGGPDGIIVDCLTLWVSNLVLRGDRDDAILEQADALAGLIRGGRSPLALVSNEVGEGVHPETAMGLRFRDLLGHVNQRVAAACETVVLMVAGIPLAVKGQVARA